tara:strand:+ start:2852 stop:3424 length:573 start_codon:yes stop_codon:yes gene_type:complete
MSTYFSNLPKVNYDISKTGLTQSVVDITRRFNINVLLKNKTAVYYNYTIQDGDRPDILAYKYYGNASYDWIILLVNEILDVEYDWPLTPTNFEAFIVDKYGSAAAANGAIRVYYRIVAAETTNSIGQRVPERLVEIDLTTYNTLSTANRKTKTSYDWEFDKNEAKRNILILDKKYLDKVLNEASKLYDGV